MMRYSLLAVGLLVALAALADAGVVQSRYRNVKEILVPVTVLQDGEVFPEIPKVLSEVKPVYENIPETPYEEQKALIAAEVAVEAQRRIDDDILEEDIKEVVEEENKELLKTLQKKVEQLEAANEQLTKQDEPAQEVVKTVTDKFVLLSDIVPNADDIIKKKQPVEQKKLQQEKDSAVTGDVQEDEPEGSLRQATQATPSQVTTQQNFVQQLIQNSPLGQFFNQISGQTTQAQAAISEALATPSPTIPGFLAPAITAAQTVVNTTTSAIQGLQQFASNLGNQFQNTLSGLGGQQPVQQSVSDGTTARPAGPFQQLVNTFIGNNNQQATPAPQQGPLQGLLNIFQGNNNNNNNNKPQANEAPVTVAQPAPAKQPEVVEQPNVAAEAASPNTENELSNEIRSSAESEDSFEEVVQPEEMIIVQDDASQRQN